MNQPGQLSFEVQFNRGDKVKDLRTVIEKALNGSLSDSQPSPKVISTADAGHRDPSGCAGDPCGRRPPLEPGAFVPFTAELACTTPVAQKTASSSRAWT